jgi:DNA-binding response OmpR family regulator
MAVQSSSFDALSDLSVAAVQSGGRQAIRILLAEANKEYADVLITALAERGIGVRHFADSREFLRTLDQAIDAHVIVLDWHMPRMSGIDLLAAIRRRGIKLPVVFLTGQNLIQYENQAFERGAMDFIEKSRGVETLVWRLKRVVTSAGSDQAGAGCTAQGRLTLHRHVSRALWDGLDLHLTVGEYNVVELWRSMPATTPAIGRSMMCCAARDSYRAAVSKVIAPTSARRSNACATSFGPSIRTSTRSKAMWRSATAGTPAATDSLDPTASNQPRPMRNA